MNGATVDSCAVAHHQISLEIDQSLSVSDARELGAHLATCEACQRFRLEIRELSDRMAELPIRLGTRDLAHRARAIAAKRIMARRRPREERWQRAAAILIGALAALNGYGIAERSLERIGADGGDGFQLDSQQLATVSLHPRAPTFASTDHGTPSASTSRTEVAEQRLDLPPVTPSEVALEPAEFEDSASEDLDPSLDEVASADIRDLNSPQIEPTAIPAVATETSLHPYIARAGRALLSDLAVLDEIPQGQRIPLIEAQMKRFGLTDWVARERADKGASAIENDLALVLMRVQDALDSPSPEVALDGLRSDPAMGDVFATLRSIGPVTEATAEHRPDPKAVVADVAGRLGDAERMKLEELLQFKEAWIEGMYGPAVRAATGAGEDGAKLNAEPFGAAMRVAVVSALTEAGGRKPSNQHKKKGKKHSSQDDSIHVPFQPIEFMHLENARFDVGKDGESLSIRVEYGGDKH